MVGEDARGIAKTNPVENNKGGQQKTSLFKTEMCYNFQRSGGQCKGSPPSKEERGNPLFQR
uniref:Candidate secreted effector n=1 Tax=Meloidogyne incognita TaxID=6306 RepID=A0A914MGJ4_MELIC